MRSLFAAFAALSIVGCSAAPESPEPVVSEESQAVTSYSAWNSTTSIPAHNQKFCHATQFSGSGAHSQSPNWPGTSFPKFGAVYSASPPAMSAYPNNDSTPDQGAAFATTRCNTFSEFGFGSQASQSSDTSPYYFAWGLNGSGGGVSAVQYMWNYPASFCFLNGAGHMSHWAEEIAVFVPGGGQSNWGFYAGGVPALSASAKCIYPDRPWLYAGQGDAWKDETVSLQMGASEGECFISRIQGSLDDGSVRLFQSWGLWMLQTTGTVEHAQAYCVRYVQ